MMPIPEKTSRTLMVAHVLAIVMIIAIHYNTKGDPPSGGNTWSGNYIVQEMLTNGLARSGVPYFALMSGFFLFSRFPATGSYGKLLFRKWRTLCIPYLLAASIIYWSVAAAKWIKGNASFLDLKTALLGMVIAPISGQFWFLRDLCILVIIAPLLFPRGGPLRRLCGGLFFLLWLCEWQIAPRVGGWYVLNAETLFFFYLGGQLSRRTDLLDRLVNMRASSNAAMMLLLGIVLFARIRMEPAMDLWYAAPGTYGTVPLLLYKAAIVLGVAGLIRISAAFHKEDRWIYLSGLTFFAFLFHFVPLNIAVFRLSGAFLAKEYGFYLAFPLATVIVFCAAGAMAEYAPRLFGILCGNRSPSKALARNRSVRGEGVAPGPAS